MIYDLSVVLTLKGQQDRDNHVKSTFQKL